jgi:hypothetical protein
MQRSKCNQYFRHTAISFDTIILIKALKDDTKSFIFRVSYHLPSTYLFCTFICSLFDNNERSSDYSIASNRMMIAKISWKGRKVEGNGPVKI